LSPDRPGEEFVVLAMVPPGHEARAGSAMAELGMKMLAHGPVNWMSKNFDRILVPDLGPVQGLIEWMGKNWPETSKKLLMRGVGHLSSVITAVYDDRAKVTDLIKDLKGEWIANNREKGLPISLVISSLFDDARKCCRETGLTPHTYLHSLGFYGKVEELPDEDELEIITMCGHGLIAAKRVRRLVSRIEKGELTPEVAAHDVAKPCVCGIVNEVRAKKIFERMVRG